MTSIDCESRIERVVVYARGAVVTRKVALPADLPEGPLDLRVPGVTALAEAGSLRAIAEGDREVTALRPRLTVPSAPVRPGSLREEARAVLLERQRLDAERAHISWRRAELGARAVEPLFSRWSRRADPAGRFGDALALSGLLTAEIEQLDARICDLDEAIADNQRRAEAAQVALAQGSSAEILGEERTRLEVLIRLGGADASRAKGAETGLFMEYVVSAARWWPAYTARFSAQATRVNFTIDAFVAQASGEDWTRAHIAVSTADLAHDARLPELRALRLGRAQPSPRRGYRPPPAGLDAMFEGYDRALERLAKHGEAAPDPAQGSLPRMFACRNVLWETFDELARDLEVSVDYLINESMKQYARSRSYAPRAPAAAPAGARPAPMPPPPAPGRASAPPAFMPPPPAAYAAMPSAPPPMQAAKTSAPVAQSLLSAEGGAPPRGPMPLSRSAPALAPEQAKGKSGGLGGLLRRSDEGALYEETVDSLVDSELSLPLTEPGAGLEAGIEPGDAWLDFDALVIAEPSDPARRGRLCRADQAGASARIVSACAAIDAVAAPPWARDPLETRGRFDHRYDAEGTADVPSSGRPHRIAIATAEGAAKPRFVTVPREVAEVYREVEIQNPFGAPLLSGPVEVFIDGALLTTSSLSFVDKSGFLYLGLGVEDRIRVARNVRVQEGSAGLLGGSTTVEHAITIDVSSSLGQKVSVDVLDRVPVTDDKDIDVKLLHARPEPEKYTQAERGAPIRRGLRFRIEVPPGEKQRIDLAYRVTLPAKNELVGGNRRE